MNSKRPIEHRIAGEVSLATQPEGSTPDVVMYSPVTLDFGDEPARRTDALLLCIEIQSPSQSPEQMEKTRTYFTFGVRSGWIIVPAVRGVFVFDEPNWYPFFHNTDVLRDPALGIAVSLNAIFS